MDHTSTHRTRSLFLFCFLLMLLKYLVCLDFPLDLGILIIQTPEKVDVILVLLGDLWRSRAPLLCIIRKQKEEERG